MAGIIALRKQCGDRALERKFADLIPDNYDDVSATACACSADPSATASVYKYFDKAGILIYVGITECGIARNRQHNESKEWWKFVHRQQIEHFQSRAVAHEREVQLIERFRPPFNKQHNKDHGAARRFYLDMTQAGNKVLDTIKHFA